MSLFSVALLYERLIDEGKVPADALWEESIVLVEANSEAEARARAASIAPRGESTYPNAAGENIAWQFRQVGAIFQILVDTLSDGTEIFSRTLRREEVDSLMRPYPESAASR